jgi:hypothetical protein
MKNFDASEQFNEERLGFDDFYNVVLERLLHFFEPVGDPGRYGDHVPFGEVMDFATTYIGSALLIRGSYLATNHCASSNEGCFAIEDIECIGFLIMHFDLPRTSALQYLNIEIWGRDESSAFRNLFMIDECDLSCSGSRCDNNCRDQRCENQPKLHNFIAKPPLRCHTQTVKKLPEEVLDFLFCPPLGKAVTNLKHPDQFGAIGRTFFDFRGCQMFPPVLDFAGE